MSNAKNEAKNEETGATATSRAINKLLSIARAFAACGDAETHEDCKSIAAQIGKLGAKEAEIFESALSPRRANQYEAGESVKVAPAYASLYAVKGALEIVAVLTVGGDANGRGGRSWLKAKAGNGNVISAPASCFEPA